MTVAIPAWVDGKLRPVEKLEVHERGLRHKAISVFVFCDDALLIQQRALGKYHTPGLWANTCCSHPNWGEDSLDCAHRRVREELGLEDLDLVKQTTVEYRADVGRGLTEHEIVDIFTASVATEFTPDPNPSEVMDTRWVSIDELGRKVSDCPQHFTPWLKIYLDMGLLHPGTQVHLVLT